MRDTRYFEIRERRELNHRAFRADDLAQVQSLPLFVQRWIDDALPGDALTAELWKEKYRIDIKCYVGRG
jgi:hypothetical protein